MTSHPIEPVAVVVDDSLSPVRLVPPASKLIEEEKKEPKSAQTQREEKQQLIMPVVASQSSDPYEVNHQTLQMMLDQKFTDQKAELLNEIRQEIRS